MVYLRGYWILLQRIEQEGWWWLGRLWWDEGAALSPLWPSPSHLAWTEQCCPVQHLPEQSSTQLPWGSRSGTKLDKTCFYLENYLECVINLLPIASVAEIGNLLLSFISAWMVGNVDAPANANMIDPKAENDILVLRQNSFVVYL